jgi:hypothetical protein
MMMNFICILFLQVEDGLLVSGLIAEGCEMRTGRLENWQRFCRE